MLTWILFRYEERIQSYDFLGSVWLVTACFVQKQQAPSYVSVRDTSYVSVQDNRVEKSLL